MFWERSVSSVGLAIVGSALVVPCGAVSPLWLAIMGPLLFFLTFVPALPNDGALAGIPFESWDRAIRCRIHGQVEHGPDYGGGWFSLALGDLLVISLTLVPILLLVMAVSWGLPRWSQTSASGPALAISYVGKALSAGPFLMWRLTWAGLLEDLRDVTTECLPVDLRRRFLGERAVQAETAFAACERASGR